MTETKSEYRCETCAFLKIENLSLQSLNGEQRKNVPFFPTCTAKGMNNIVPCWKFIESVGCASHSAITTQNPPYQDLIDHIRWTQNLWRHGIEIMRKNNLVVASDTPMEKLAFTFYSDLCEIDSRALHLFGEGPGDENYKDQSAIKAREIVPYPRPYEEAIEQAALIEMQEDIMQYVRKHEWISSEYNNQMHVLTVRPFERFLESLRHATGGPCNKVRADKGASDND